MAYSHCVDSANINLDRLDSLDFLLQFIGIRE